VLIHGHPDQWTKIRGDVLSNKNLAQVGEQHGLGKCINVNGGTLVVSAGMIATAVEAILGAVHKDGGHDALAGVMDRLGLTGHALLLSVISVVSLHPPWYTEQLLAYSLHLLGPFVAAPGLHTARALQSQYAIGGN